MAKPFDPIALRRIVADYMAAPSPLQKERPRAAMPRIGGGLGGQVLGHSHQRVTELYAHLLPGHLDRARNAVNLGPTLQTVAMSRETANSPKKIHTRH
jgi:hypothetical protein